MKKNAEASPPATTPLLHTIAETQELLGGISRTMVYELFTSGRLKSVKLGSRRLVPHTEVVRCAESLESAT